MTEQWWAAGRVEALRHLWHDVGDRSATACGIDKEPPGGLLTGGVVDLKPTCKECMDTAQAASSDE